MRYALGSLFGKTGLAVAVAFSVGATAQTAKADAEPFIGEMMQFGGNFCPRGWAKADGQLLAISSNDALFSLLGTIYGGDGRTTFALPDLRSRAVVHTGSGPGLPTVHEGEKGGTVDFGLNLAQAPSHNHAAAATVHTHESGAANADAPGGALHAAVSEDIYSTQPPDVTMGTAANPAVTVTIGNSGSGQPIAKRSPFLALTWCVALVGIYPSRS